METDRLRTQEDVCPLRFPLLAGLLTLVALLNVVATVLSLLGA